MYNKYHTSPVGKQVFAIKKAGPFGPAKGGSYFPATDSFLTMSDGLPKQLPPG